MRMIAGETPGWETTLVFLDGVKVEKCIEADDDLGKAWVEIDEHPGYKVLTGKVEFRERIISDGIPAKIEFKNNYKQEKKQHSDVGFFNAGDVVFEDCSDPECPYCNSGWDGSISVGNINSGYEICGDKIIAAQDIEAEWIDDPANAYKLGKEITLTLKPVKVEQVTGVTIDGDTITFPAVNLCAGDTLNVSYEVHEDGTRISSVSIIRA